MGVVVGVAVVIGGTVEKDPVNVATSMSMRKLRTILTV